MNRRHLPSIVLIGALTFANCLHGSAPNRSLYLRFAASYSMEGISLESRIASPHRARWTPATGSTDCPSWEFRFFDLQGNFLQAHRVIHERLCEPDSAEPQPTETLEIAFSVGIDPYPAAVKVYRVPAGDSTSGSSVEIGSFDL